MKTMLMQNCGGQVRCIMGDVQVAYVSKNKIYFHINSFALGLALKQRLGANRKYGPFRILGQA